MRWVRTGTLPLPDRRQDGAAAMEVAVEMWSSAVKPRCSGETATGVFWIVVERDAVERFAGLWARR